MVSKANRNLDGSEIRNFLLRRTFTFNWSKVASETKDHYAVFSF